MTSASSQVRIDHMVLLVASLERSMPYYQALLPELGFSNLEGHYWRSASGFIIQFQEAHPETRPYERYGAGLNHLGFSVAAPEQVSAIQCAMRNAGHDAPEIQNLDGVTALFMKDPDGIRFEISYFPPEIDINR